MTKERTSLFPLAESQAAPQFVTRRVRNLVFRCPDCRSRWCIGTPDKDIFSIPTRKDDSSGR